MNLRNKKALVTGGGAGIGLAITQALVAAGAHVLIAGRDLGRLERVKAELGDVTTIQVDLAVYSERERLIAQTLASDLPIDLLVNNAGIMQYFALNDDRALARLDAELALDLHAPIHLATALLPHLLARPDAAIVNVTTGLIYAPFGTTPGYSAAKAGLHEFTRSLRWQTRSTTLKVIELMPPTVDTALTRRLDSPKINPARIATALIDGIQKGTDEIRPGQTKALYALSRLAPDFIYRTLNKVGDKVPLD
ncbi:putative oxidoreductase [Rhizobium sp. PP-F2F-G38]|nr:putative oxidoreductase [Rhizobium sp. PP-WC-1G-195]PYE91441.1 putative oxidoreductase [Rhizobium sp. PP-F2F-G38]TCL87974.1 putative oxidoreductase [Rhizobium sp. PP-WC-2G-219]TCP74504.1 putative oxidoreductase [Rhizobium sp. PP-CC-2G-626]TCQ03355.1 putative oxidoreductase [Rhizobium sp. PP-F2F-G36]